MPARDRASVVSAAGEVEKMGPLMSRHVSVTKKKTKKELRSRGNGQNDNKKCVLTIH